MKIGYKLTAGFLVVLTFVLVSGCFAVLTGRKILQDTIGKDSMIMAENIIDKIDRDINDRIREYQIYSADLVLRQAILESNEEFNKLESISDYINEKEREWALSARDELTPFITKILFSAMSDDLKQKIKTAEKIYGFKIYGEIFVTNRYGVNVAMTGKTSDYYQADEEWWQEAEKNGLYVGDVNYDESARIYSIDIGVRVDDDEGNFSGVIKAVLDIRRVRNILKEEEKSKRYRTRHFCLIDKDGRIIYSTVKFKLFERVSDNLYRHFSSKNRPGGYFIEKRKEKEELLVYVRSRGHGDFKGLGWILLVGYQTDEILLPVVDLAYKIAGFSLIAALLAVCLGLIVSKSITGPVGYLRRVVDKIGRGHMDTEITVRGNDEIGSLAVSFKNMAESLNKTTVSKEYVNNIIETMTDSLVVILPEGRIDRVNKATLDLLDYKKEELIGKDASCLFLMGIKGVLLKESFNGGALVNYRTTYKRKDGMAIPVLLSGGIMRGEHEGIVNIVCVAKDIREYLKREEELKKVNRELVDNETALKNMLYDLKETHDDLKNAQKQLIQSEKLASIGQLAAGIAHEINNPLGLLSAI
ncbi:MAG: PAS domain S-box protein [Candidatus Omnitrophota bacterium]